MKHEKFENYFRQIDKIYDEITGLEDPVIKDFVSFYSRWLTILTKANLGVGLFSILGIIVNAFFSKKTLIFHLWIPGVDIMASPTFEIIFVFEVG